MSSLDVHSWSAPHSKLLFVLLSLFFFSSCVFSYSNYLPKTSLQKDGQQTERVITWSS